MDTRPARPHPSAAASSSFSGVFLVLRVALHVLVLGLTIFVIVRAYREAPFDAGIAGISVAFVFAFTYIAGVWLIHGVGRSQHTLWNIWLGLLSLEWIVLVWFLPEAAYLLFPLLFLYLEFLPVAWGIAVSVVATFAAIAGIGAHDGFSAGGVVGPLIGTTVAILIGFGYRALAREVAVREDLMAELVATRAELAASERTAGATAERARLARDIHDTVSQSLSSITLYLQAADRAETPEKAREHTRAARESAAEGLSASRHIIHELTPRELDGTHLGGALRRLAMTQWTMTGLDVRIRVSDMLRLPLDVEATLLRIVQGAMANVVRHSGASVATVSISHDRSSVLLTIVDDGCGFDVAAAAARAGSFGLTAMGERVEQWGGTLTLDSAPGAGTTVRVELELDA